MKSSDNSVNRGGTHKGGNLITQKKVGECYESGNRRRRGGAAKWWGRKKGRGVYVSRALRRDRDLGVEGGKWQGMAQLLLFGKGGITSREKRRIDHVKRT